MGRVFFVTFIDDFSRKVFVRVIKKKSDVYQCFLDYKTLVENQTGKKIKILRSDNGGEFCGNVFENFLKANGIIHQRSAPYTPQQNGLAERFNRTIMEKVRCMLFDANLSKNFWGEAVAAACKTINMIPNSSNKSKSPDEIWFNKDVDTSILRVFGCKAMVHVPNEKRTKLDSKSTECFFVGYSDESKAYRLYNRTTRRVIISRDVVFLEDNNIEVNDEFHDSNPFISVYEESEGIFVPNERDADENENDATIVDNQAAGGSNVSNIRDKFRNNIELEGEVNLDNSIIYLDSTGSADETSMYESMNNSVIGDPNFDPANVTTNSTDSEDQDDENTSRAQTRSGVRNPGQFNLLNQNNAHIAFVTGEPTTVDEALLCDNANKWILAMKEEHTSLIENKTWTLVNLPAGKKAIRCKWVFKQKSDENGNVTRHKARLVAKGCSQKPGIDFNEIFSPVVRYTSIRYLFSIAAQYDLLVYQMDAVTAFLQGDLYEEVYMQQPEYFDDASGKVCLLKKSIYGLKQASRMWNIKLHNVLISGGYTQSKVDPCIYFKIQGVKKLFVAIYVDDVLYFTNANELKKDLSITLMSNFKMKDLGLARYCVGIRITRNKTTGEFFLD